MKPRLKILRDLVSRFSGGLGRGFCVEYEREKARRARLLRVLLWLCGFGCGGAPPVDDSRTLLITEQVGLRETKTLVRWNA